MRIKIFEQFDSEIEEIKSIFIEYAQDHDMKFVDPDKIQPSDWDDEGGGIYNIRRENFHGKENLIIVEFVWEFRDFEPVVDIDKYFDDLEEYKDRLMKMGYDIEEYDDTNVQFRLLLTSKE